VWGAALAVCLVGFAFGARAEEECPLWFPDFRCEREGRLPGFEKPIVAPYLFEDPFVTTGAYPYFVWHDFPRRSVFRGGDASVVALQLRVAITDRLAFIATKDGYMWHRPDLDLLDHQQGWMNLAGGLKYNFLLDRDRRFALSGILRYEAPTGSDTLFSGQGDGIVMPSLSAAWGPGDLRLVGDFGASWPIDGSEDSTSLFYHLYGAWVLHEHLSPFLQLSGIHYLSSGNGHRAVVLKNGAKLPLDLVQHVLGTGHFEGVDVFNLGSRGVDGDDFLTLAVGVHVPITQHVTFSVAYERPISSEKGIFGQRVTSSVAFEF
jgi:hypothetical protein